MTDHASRASSALALIESNIKQFGHHTYLVTGGPSPRFAYTIGLSQALGAELALPGASFFTAQEVKRIVDEIVHHLRAQGTVSEKSLDLKELGTFFLRRADPSWTKMLLLGAMHFYKEQEISAFQICPDETHATIDVPDLGRVWNSRSEPVWQWLREPWPYPVSERSVATTNLNALRGARVTEAARWEPDQWEMFAGAGPDVAQEDVRVVPLATLLAADRSLEQATTLEVGKALWRNASETEWHPWATGA